MGFSRQEYRSGLPLLSPGDLPNPGSEPRCPTLQVNSLPPGSPRKPKNTGMVILSLLQGIFLSQESNQGLLHCRWILYQLSYQRSPSVYVDLKLISHLLINIILKKIHMSNSMNPANALFCYEYFWSFKLVCKFYNQLANFYLKIAGILLRIVFEYINQWGENWWLNILIFLICKDLQLFRFSKIILKMFCNFKFEGITYNSLRWIMSDSWSPKKI